MLLDRGRLHALAELLGDAAFLRWYDGRGIGALDEVEPVDVAAYIELPCRLLRPPLGGPSWGKVDFESRTKHAVLAKVFSVEL